MRSFSPVISIRKFFISNFCDVDTKKKKERKLLKNSYRLRAGNTTSSFFSPIFSPFLWTFTKFGKVPRNEEIRRKNPVHLSPLPRPPSALLSICTRFSFSFPALPSRFPFIIFLFCNPTYEKINIIEFQKKKIIFPLS